MFTKLREPFGKAGLTVAVIALVFAMLGGAYAASGLNGKQKKEVTKIAKQYAGKPGAAGAPGPAGAAGAKGDAGAAGANGSAGTAGVSPIGAAFAGNANGCSEGGVKFTGANTTVACNGVKGTTGFTETLPSEKTETGGWAYGRSEDALLISAISFPIPLASPPTGEIIDFGDTTDNCQGSATAPSAEPGFVCLYLAESAGAVPDTILPGTWGATLVKFDFEPSSPEEQAGYGSFAVTAP